MPDDILQKAAESLRRAPPVLDPAELKEFVEKFLDRAPAFLAAAQAHGTPLYLFDRKTLLERAARFKAAFEAHLGSVQVFYAVKSNNHPEVARALAGFGLGLDVSSGLELELALEAGAAEIVFSGPGKTAGELDLAVARADRVTVLIDSFGELERLEKAAAGREVMVRAGVRLTTQESGLWRKFGIPLTRLEEFFETAAARPHVALGGLQFHTSWNLDPSAQVDFLARLGRSLADMSPAQRRAIEFLDIGGGFWPPKGEWLTWASTPPGRLAQAVEPGGPPSTGHFVNRAAPLDTFAQEIGRAIREHIRPHVAEFQIYTEPGRWLSHEAMHLLLRVVDKKAQDLVITDGGTNIIGWERFENEYFPVINLTRPADEERPCLICGSLCTPHDVWGSAYFGADIEEGDVLLIPCQGAYTYSLGQRFIKPLAKVATWSA
ncbi:MAG: alanine racemase [Proteobacteria bacterium]|nr:alanine racemase [Pseudomonadota bacterium]